VTSTASSPTAGWSARRVEELLAGDHAARRLALDQRYAALDDVLDGRRAAVVYPAARLGRHAAAALRARGARVVALGDRDPAFTGQDLDGLPVLSPVAIAEKHADAAVLVASTMHDSAIRRELTSLGCATVVPVGYLNLRLPDVFPAREYDGAWAVASDPDRRTDILRAFALLGDEASRRVFAARLAFFLSLDKGHLDEQRSAGPMYFDRSVFSLKDDEVVADGGAFTGDTMTEFLRICDGRFRGYVAFEPDAASYAALARLAAADTERIVTVAAGLGDSPGPRRLSGTAAADSHVLAPGEPGGDLIDVVSLDDYFQDKPSPTLIKLDIEGEEAAALRGGSGILRHDRPVLAVSAYHHPADLWSLPLLISRLMPDAPLYLRHYGEEIDDTVCYAVPRA